MVFEYSASRILLHLRNLIAIFWSGIGMFKPSRKAWASSPVLGFMQGRYSAESVDLITVVPCFSPITLATSILFRGSA